MKRVLDIVIASTALAALALPLLAIALAVRLLLGKPVFFVQERSGLHGVPFKLVKFRTMLEAYDTHGKPLNDGVRMTRFGNLLRAMSLDELPELINVLEGAMSLVGPRPLMTEYLPLYTEEQRRRHEVKPGITGWAQVNGRNMLTWEQKFALDVWYVDHQSLVLDLKILWRTIITVLAAEGIAPLGRETMELFTGSPDSPPRAADNSDS